VTVEPAPGETAPGSLIWPDRTTVTWPATPGADSYTLYRGYTYDALPRLVTTQTDSCTRSQGPATTVTGLTETPPDPGEFYWWLVTASSDAGCEGSAGPGRIVDSTGACPP
jgi:hypothetical protein